MRFVLESAPTLDSVWLLHAADLHAVPPEEPVPLFAGLLFR